MSNWVSHLILHSFGDDIPGMEGLGTGEFLLGPKFAEHSGVSIYLNYPPVLSDITVICPWEAFSHLELHELAQYGIIWAFLHPPATLWGFQAGLLKPSASGSISNTYMEPLQRNKYNDELQQT